MSEKQQDSNQITSKYMLVNTNKSLKILIALKLILIRLIYRKLFIHIHIIYTIDNYDLLLLFSLKNNI